MFQASAINAQSYSKPALVFYRISDRDEPLINRIAAYMTGTHGMAHVELRFSNGESLSIFQDEVVFLKKRGYSNQNYEIMPLSNITKEAESVMYKFAQQQVGKRFNASGLRRAWLPWFLRRNTDGAERRGRWFCSELVVSTLHKGGLLPKMTANSSSPNQLYVSAKKSESRLGGCVGVNKLAFSARKIDTSTIMFSSNTTRSMQQNNGIVGGVK